MDIMYTECVLCASLTRCSLLSPRLKYIGISLGSKWVMTKCYAEKFWSPSLIFYCTHQKKKKKSMFFNCGGGNLLFVSKKVMSMMPRWKSIKTYQFNFCEIC